MSGEGSDIQQNISEEDSLLSNEYKEYRTMWSDGRSVTPSTPSSVKENLNEFKHKITILRRWGLGLNSRTFLCDHKSGMIVLKIPDNIAHEVIGARLSKIPELKCKFLGWKDTTEGMGFIYPFMGGRVSKEIFFMNLNSDLALIRKAGLQHCDVHADNISSNGHLIDFGCMNFIGHSPRLIKRRFEIFLDIGVLEDNFDKRCVELLPNNLWELKQQEWMNIYKEFCKDNWVSRVIGSENATLIYMILLWSGLFVLLIANIFIFNDECYQARYVSISGLFVMSWVTVIGNSGLILRNRKEVIISSDLRKRNGENTMWGCWKWICPSKVRTVITNVANDIGMNRNP